MAARRVGLRQVRALKPGEIVWDRALSGFGARRQKSEAVSYFLLYRNKSGRQRWYTIGRHGAWTPETARDEAKRLLGEISGGADPVADKIVKRNAASVSQLCDQYLSDAESGKVLKRSGKPKKQSTLTIDRGRIERHIKPLIGSHAVASVTQNDIDSLLHDIADGKVKAAIKTKKLRGLALVKGGKAAANRTVGLLGAIFTYAIRHRMRSDNPVRGTQKFADEVRERRLSDDEYKALGTALQKAHDAKLWPPAVSATRFLALTGWRRGEALGLRWDDLDLSRRTATLGDTKTGRSIRPLSNAACEVLKNLNHSSGLVFPPARGNGLMSGFRKFWIKIAKQGSLSADVTPHVLRHSFASLAADLGYSEPTIAALVGHKARSTTGRYIHSADAVLLAAVDAVADRTSELMGERQTGKVFQLRPVAR